MKHYTTSDRLKQIMSERNIKQVDILNLCAPFCQKYNIKIGRNDMSQYVSGKVAPGQDKLSVLAMALGVSEVWLMGYDDPQITHADSTGNDTHSDLDILGKIGAFPIPKHKEIPLLGSIACGEPILADENINDHIGCPEDIHADFALRCKGDSMIGARLHDGDIVYIRIQPNVENGEIAAVLINDEATLKRVYQKGDSIILQPENPAYEPMVFFREEINNIRILGKAICFISKIK